MAESSQPPVFCDTQHVEPAVAGVGAGVGVGVVALIGIFFFFRK